MFSDNCTQTELFSKFNKNDIEMIYSSSTTVVIVNKVPLFIERLHIFHQKYCNFYLKSLKYSKSVLMNFVMKL